MPPRDYSRRSCRPVLPLRPECQRQYTPRETGALKNLANMVGRLGEARKVPRTLSGGNLTLAI